MHSDTATFDPNFCLPYRVLENERVKLVPFIVEYFSLGHLARLDLTPSLPRLPASRQQPSKHAERFIAASKDHPETYTYLPYGPFDSASELLDEFVFKRVQPNRDIILYTVFNKEADEDGEVLAAAKLDAGLQRDDNGADEREVEVEVEDAQYAIAGLTGLLNTSPEHLKTEIGFVYVLPKFQKTHVTTNMVGLMLEFCFAPGPSPSLSESPSPSPSAGTLSTTYGEDLNSGSDSTKTKTKTNTETWGLNFRRVQWQANTLNTASIRAAERMGFVREGTLRWDRVLPPGKLGVNDPGAQALALVSAAVGNGNGNGDGKPGRHTAILAVCWDEWEERRGVVRERMRRRV